MFSKFKEYDLKIEKFHQNVVSSFFDCLQNFLKINLKYYEENRRKNRKKAYPTNQKVSRQQVDQRLRNQTRKSKGAPRVHRIQAYFDFNILFKKTLKNK